MPAGRRDNWRRGGYRGDYYCSGRRWDRQVCPHHSPQLRRAHSSFPSKLTSFLFCRGATTMGWSPLLALYCLLSFLTLLFVLPSTCVALWLMYLAWLAAGTAGGTPRLPPFSWQAYNFDDFPQTWDLRLTRCAGVFYLQEPLRPR